MSYITRNSVLITDSNDLTVNHFDARVSSYDIYTGVIVLDSIVNVEGFQTGVNSSYNVNLDGIDGPTRPTGNKGPLETLGQLEMQDLLITLGLRETLDVLVMRVQQETPDQLVTLVLLEIPDQLETRDQRVTRVRLETPIQQETRDLQKALAQHET